MPYTIPTASDFKARHVAFVDLTNSYIDAVMLEASRFVDESWLEPDYQPALMFLTAHMLVSEGALGARADTAGLITSEKLGDAAVTYGNAVSEMKSVSDYTSTSYGRRYLQLLRVNQPGVMIT
jgi:glucose dehydrogenase